MDGVIYNVFYQEAAALVSHNSAEDQSVGSIPVQRLCGSGLQDGGKISITIKTNWLSWGHGCNHHLEVMLPGRPDSSLKETKPRTLLFNSDVSGLH